MKKYVLILLACYSCAGAQQVQQTVTPALAFPTAEGAGKYTTGGRHGKVIVVTNLNDSGAGSLRAAVMEKYPRIVVFAVSGTIQLKSPLKITSGNLTIAGQSAPGDGICIRDYTVSIQSNNVILRYLRFRLGDETKQEDDAINAIRRENIIIDHCSMTWATDECASFYDNKHFTLQWCIIAESLRHSVHHKGEHGYGGIWGGQSVSFHHNLLAHNTSRNPRFCGARYTHDTIKELVDFRNNVLYNWGFNSAYGGEGGNCNIVNNYYKAGPATRKSVANRIVNPADTPYGKFFIVGNYVDGFPAITNNNWAGGVHCADKEAAKATLPFPITSIPAESATDAYEQVLQLVGASYKRDVIDTRIVQEVRNNNPKLGKEQNGIIDSQTEAGGWPLLKSLPPLKDSDNDGMPDDWEDAHHLDKHNPNDAAGHHLHPQYTNIEIYVESLLQQA
ncbi:hypothetical protein LX64_02475 [Chitinophaga skermanii]|uniref:Pectate lyase domain-containing protein n=1 Tax=Chitinophaga skermanii TaxID=331697 RepID=A0A327QMP9_9BACT|nr:pectate lyase [Chitinophaga skermanii]RAJ05318.1 hypothetical protein LX64_02475 [Chitinophaga skermanii]